MYKQNTVKRGFGFKKTTMPKLKDNYIPRRKPPPKQIAIRDDHMKNLDLMAIQEFINEDWKCPHTENGTEFYSFSYCKEGVVVEFSKEGCKGQGQVYIDLFDYSIVDIVIIVPCS